MLAKDKIHLYKYAAFFVLYEVSTYLANDMIMPGMVQVVKDFHAPLSDAAVSLSYFIIGGSVLPLFLNVLADKIGHRKVLIAGNGLFLLTTILIPFSQNINQFLLARLFQGMGLGFIFIGYATVHKLFDDLAAIKLIALLSNISLMAPLVGPLIGGAITNSYNWRFVFILIGILALFSLYGIYRHMPDDEEISDKPNSTAIFKHYWQLIKSKGFLIGALIGGLNNVVNTSWTGISPVIILDTYHKPFADYATYQILVFSGTTISSILIQFMAANSKIIKLIKAGSVLSLCGLIFSFLFSFNSKILCVFGIFIFTLGSGLYLGIVNRILISSFRHYRSAVSALNSIIIALCSALGLEIGNYICSKINYNFPTLTMFNLIVGISCFSITNYYLRVIKDYECR